MVTRFNYQLTISDCVPTSFCNGLLHLYGTKFPPEVLRFIHTTCMDAQDDNGRIGRNGTSSEAIKMVCRYISEFVDSVESDRKHFQCNARYICKDQVHLRNGNLIDRCLSKGGVVLLCVNYDMIENNEMHYVTLFEKVKQWYYIFDPSDTSYVDRKSFINEKQVQWNMDNAVPGWVNGANLRIDKGWLSSESKDAYCLGLKSEREAVLLTPR